MKCGALEPLSQALLCQGGDDNGTADGQVEVQRVVERDGKLHLEVVYEESPASKAAKAEAARLAEEQRIEQERVAAEKAAAAEEAARLAEEQRAAEEKAAAEAEAEAARIADEKRLAAEAEVTINGSNDSGVDGNGHTVALFFDADDDDMVGATFSYDTDGSRTFDDNEPKQTQKVVVKTLVCGHTVLSETYDISDDGEETDVAENTIGTCCYNDAFLDEADEEKSIHELEAEDVKSDLDDDDEFAPKEDGELAIISDIDESEEEKGGDDEKSADTNKTEDSSEENDRRTSTLIQVAQKDEVFTPQQKQWNDKYACLLKYYNKNGTSSIPLKVAKPKHLLLRRWADLQKKAFLNDELDPNQIQKLVAIEFAFGQDIEAMVAEKIEQDRIEAEKKKAEALRLEEMAKAEAVRHQVVEWDE